MFDKTGVLLVSVPTDSQMARLGFKVDDVVIEFDEIKMPDDISLQKIMKNLKAGEHCVKVWRNQESHVFTF